MDIIIKRFNNLMLSSIIFSIIDVIIGFLLFKYTDFSMKINMIILGSLITIHGLSFIIRYVYDGLGNRFFAVDLIVGVMAVIIGVFSIFNPFNAIEVIGFFGAAWFLINAVEKLFYSIKFMQEKEEIYPLLMFISILMVIMGVACIFNPFDSFMLITRLVGLFLICSGIFDVMVSFLFRRRASNILKMFK